MTTIAANRECMAADTRQVGDVISSVSKIRRFGGSLFGCAGEMTCITLFWEWAEAGFPRKKKPTLPEGSFEVLELNAEGLWEWDRTLCRWPKRDSYHAIGTGAMSAKTAMFLRKPPKQAVEIAAQHDENTGGEVEVLDL